MPDARRDSPRQQKAAGPRRFPLPLGLTTAAVALAVVTAYLMWPRVPDAAVFDPLVDAELIEAGSTDLVPYALSRRHRDRSLHYHIEFDLDTTDPAPHAGIRIDIAGASLPRRQSGFALGPGGAGDWYVARTRDRRYEIIVTQFNRGKEGVRQPKVNTRRIANMLAERYHRTR